MFSIALKTCTPDQFTCRNKKCIKKNWTCDGDDDCSDYSDEDNCLTKSPRTCKKSEKLCEDGRLCIHTSWVCDGEADCNDGSDEKGCNSEYILSVYSIGVLIIDYDRPLIKIFTAL